MQRGALQVLIDLPEMVEPLPEGPFVRITAPLNH